MRLDCAVPRSFLRRSVETAQLLGVCGVLCRIAQPEGKLDRVSPVLRIRDTTWGEAMLPGTNEVVAPRYPLENVPVEATEAASRRQSLARWLTLADNPHFARATVNRVWFQLFGRGLVNPVDDMARRTSRFPPSAGRACGILRPLWLRFAPTLCHARADRGVSIVESVGRG